MEILRSTKGGALIEYAMVFMVSMAVALLSADYIRSSNAESYIHSKEEISVAVAHASGSTDEETHEEGTTPDVDASEEGEVSNGDAPVEDKAPGSAPETEDDREDTTGTDGYSDNNEEAESDDSNVEGENGADEAQPIAGCQTHYNRYVDEGNDEHLDAYEDCMISNENDDDREEHGLGVSGCEERREKNEGEGPDEQSDEGEGCPDADTENGGNDKPNNGNDGHGNDADGNDNSNPGNSNDPNDHTDDDGEAGKGG